MWKSFYQIESFISISLSGQSCNALFEMGWTVHHHTYQSVIQSRHGAVQRDTAWQCDARARICAACCVLYSAVCTCGGTHMPQYSSTAQARGSLINVLCLDHALNFHTTLRNQRSIYYIQRITSDILCRPLISYKKDSLYIVPANF